MAETKRKKARPEVKSGEPFFADANAKKRWEAEQAEIARLRAEAEEGK